MKIIIVLSAVAFSSLIHASSGTDGFLLFDIGRYSFHDGETLVSNINQKFKVPLTEEFLSNFKHVPSQNSGGTGFCCSGGDLKSDQGSTRFMWWLEKITNNRWRIHMWGEGVETINGVRVSSTNPKVSQEVTVKSLEDIDMSYQLSYVNEYDGINISFAVKYDSSGDVKAEGNIPTAALRRADHSELFKADDSKQCPFKVDCIFREN